MVQNVRPFYVVFNCTAISRLLILFRSGAKKPELNATSDERASTKTPTLATHKVDSCANRTSYLFVRDLPTFSTIRGETSTVRPHWRSANFHNHAYICKIAKEVLRLSLRLTLRRLNPLLQSLIAMRSHIGLITGFPK